MKYLTALSALALAFVLAGCPSLPKGDYIEADRATYEVVWPEYETYYKADPDLTDDEKALRDLLGESWDRRIAAAEGADAEGDE